MDSDGYRVNQHLYNLKRDNPVPAYIKKRRVYNTRSPTPTQLPPPFNPEHHHLPPLNMSPRRLSASSLGIPPLLK